jgi:hypothetical protein
MPSVSRVPPAARSWRAGARAFPRRRAGERAAEFLRRANAWRRTHGVPPEVFLTCDRQRPAWAVRERKPVWPRVDSRGVSGGLGGSARS